MSPKQAFLSEEMQPKTIKEIADAAEELHKIRTERIALTKQEDAAQSVLISVMEKHKLDVYKFEDGPRRLTVTIEPGKTKAKVREAAEPETEED